MSLRLNVLHVHTQHLLATRPGINPILGGLRSRYSSSSLGCAEGVKQSQLMQDERLSTPSLRLFTADPFTSRSARRSRRSAAIRRRPGACSAMWPAGLSGDSGRYVLAYATDSAGPEPGTRRPPESLAQPLGTVDDTEQTLLGQLQEQGGADPFIEGLATSVSRSPE